MGRNGKSRRSPATPAQVGSALREAREALGQSLAEVHDDTGIPWKALEALEAGDIRKMPDRQMALVGLHLYAAHVALDEWPLARVLERSWPEPTPNPQPATRFVTPSAGASWDPVGTGRAGGGLYPRTVVMPAPLPLRLAVWLVALLVAVGAAGLAAQHGAAHWLGEIRLGPAPVRPFATSQNASGTVASPATRAVVVLASSGPTSDAVSVRATQFSVVVETAARSWVQVSTSSGVAPTFAGMMQAGDVRVFDAVGGKLSMQIGAGGVTLRVRVGGQIVPGWSFRPPVAPLMLNFASTSYS
ncbi:MAG: RodZ domain-containing protein [Acidimicrobiales bacterium]